MRPCAEPPSTESIDPIADMGARVWPGPPGRCRPLSYRGVSRIRRTRSNIASCAIGLPHDSTDREGDSLRELEPHPSGAVADGGGPGQVTGRACGGRSVRASAVTRSFSDPVIRSLRCRHRQRLAGSGSRRGSTWTEQANTPLKRHPWSGTIRMVTRRHLSQHGRWAHGRRGRLLRPTANTTRPSHARK
jgi:hypothetical protein